MWATHGINLPSLANLFVNWLIGITGLLSFHDKKIINKIGIVNEKFNILFFNYVVLDNNWVITYNIGNNLFFGLNRK